MRNEERAGLQKVCFFAGSADVRLLPSRDGVFRVYPDAEEELAYLEYRYEGNTYYGRVCGREGALSSAVESLLGGLGRVVERVTLELPMDLAEVNVETVSGDLDSEGICVKHLNLSTRSGEMALTSMDCGGISVFSKRGDIRLKKLQTGTLLLESGSGDVEYKDLCAEVFTCSSFRGDLEGKRLDSRDLYFKSSSGDACFHLVERGRQVYVCRKNRGGELVLKTGRLVSEQELQSLGQDCIKLSILTNSGEVKVKRAKEKRTFR